MPEPGRLPLVETSDLSIGAGSRALTLTFARDHRAPFRPLRAAPPWSTWSRRVELTLRRRSRPCGLLRPAGEDAFLPTSATDLHNEHPMDRLTLESPSAPALADEAGFHALRPAETLAECMIEWSLA
jgi:hypothetical protein